MHKHTLLVESQGEKCYNLLINLTPMGSTGRVFFTPEGGLSFSKEHTENLFMENEYSVSLVDLKWKTFCTLKMTKITF